MKSSSFHVKGKIIAPWSEGFESATFPPCPCWTDVYGNWERYESSSNAHSGAGYAHIDFNVPEGEGILITPTLDVGYYDTLIFWWKEADYKGKDIGHDSTFVEISRDNGATWIVWKVLKAEHSATWHAETLVFGDLWSHELKIRWRYETDGSASAYGFNLDDIELRAGGYRHDIGISSITFKPDTGIKGEEDTISIKVTNNGNYDENFTLIKIVKTPSEEIGYCDTMEGLFLQAYTDTVITFYYTPDTIGNHLVIAKVMLTGDENTSNDEKIDTLYVKLPPGFASLRIKRLYLKQNIPNPFVNLTRIEVGLPAKQSFTLKIYDVSGRCVKVYRYESASPGIYIIKWNGTDNKGKKLPAGVYYCKLQTKNKVITRKMVKIK